MFFSNVLEDFRMLWTVLQLLKLQETYRVAEGEVGEEGLRGRKERCPPVQHSHV